MKVKWLESILLGAVLAGVCICSLACFEPRVGLGDQQDQFDVVLAFADVRAATGRSTINDDADVITVYAKVYDSLGNHVPAVDNTGSDIPGVTKLTKGEGSWSGTVNLVDSVSGTITFEVWAVASSGVHLYEGETDHVVGTNSNSITVVTQAVYTVGSTGPAGGFVFYDKGAYSDGWRFLEAAPYGWYNEGADPSVPFGYYRETSGGANLSVNTGEGIGTGEDNTALLVAAMESAAYTASTGTDTTSSYAAKLCSDYSVSVGGTVYDDWFLPSSGPIYSSEIDEMYKNLKNTGLGGFANDAYWSSREVNALSAYYCGFINGAGNYTGRNVSWRVRPARAF